MSLRWKLSLAVLAVAVGVVGAIFAISQLTFARDFQKIENQQANEMARRAGNALSDRLQSLHVLNYDWAAWDETYNFVQAPEQHEDYIIDNPTDTTFAHAGLNFLFIIDNAGRVVYSKGFDLSRMTGTPIPASLTDRVSDGALAHRSNIDDTVAEVILLPEGPILLSSRPIVTSQDQGPVAGTIIMVRLVDRALVDDIQSKLLLPVALVPIKDMPASLQATGRSPRPSTSTVAEIVDSKQIDGYVLVRDMNGSPSLIFKVMIPRYVYAQRIATTRYFLVSLLGIGVLFTLIFNVLLGRMVTSRVHRVGAYVGNVAEKGDLSKRLPVRGSDELARLSKDTNQMIEALDQSRLALRKKEEEERRLRRMFESAAEGIASTSLTGVITDLNDSKLHLHGYSTKRDLVGTMILDLVAPQDRNKARDNMEEALQTGNVGEGEYAMLKKDGRTFLAELSAAVLRDDDERPIGFVVRTRDVAARERVAVEPVVDSDGWHDHGR